VQVEDHVAALHFGEDGVEGFVVDDAGGGVLGTWLALQLGVGKGKDGGLTVVTPAGYDLTPVMPAFLASRMVSGVVVS
jgi:hypothetical protein